MISASLYKPIYWAIVTILSIWVFAKYKYVSMDGVTAKSVRVNARGAVINAPVVLLLAMIAFIGLRPVSGVYFVDMAGYYDWYNHTLGDNFTFSLHTENFIWDNLFAWWIYRKLGFSLFMLLVATIYFGCAFAACKKMFPNDTLTVFLVFLGAFSTFSYGTNGIKAGAAASVCLLALAYKDKLVPFVILLIASWGLHHSMVMVLVSVIIAKYVKNTKLFFVVWGLSLLIAAAHIDFFQGIFASMADERGMRYLQTESNYEGYYTGFRFDFVIYSAMPIIIGWFLLMKRNIKDNGYEFWLRVYLISNSIWMLCMYASFTNRIAYLSWFLYPIVLIYPFFKFKWSAKQYVIGRNIAFAQLAFTLFMEFAYYAKP